MINRLHAVSQWNLFIGEPTPFSHEIRHAVSQEVRELCFKPALWKFGKQVAVDIRA